MPMETAAATRAWPATSAVSSIDQNRIDEAKLSDAGCNLFDLSGRVCARIARARCELAGDLIFDGERSHDASDAGLPSDLRDRRIRPNVPNFGTAVPISAAGFPNYFQIPESSEVPVSRARQAGVNLVFKRQHSFSHYLSQFP